jgi:hypothetical protein
LVDDLLLYGLGGSASSLNPAERPPGGIRIRSRERPGNKPGAVAVELKLSVGFLEAQDPFPVLNNIHHNDQSEPDQAVDSIFPFASDCS